MCIPSRFSIFTFPISLVKGKKGNKLVFRVWEESVGRFRVDSQELVEKNWKVNEKISRRVDIFEGFFHFSSSVEILGEIFEIEEE